MKIFFDTEFIIHQGVCTLLALGADRVPRRASATGEW